MPRFDRILVVDWSAASAPTPVRPAADAIWIGTDGPDGPADPVYCRTRAQAEDWLRGRLRDLAARGRRALVACDFPFGYPRGFAPVITGRSDALAVWDRLAALIADDRANRNNRFAVAEALNRAFPGIGPFWGRPKGHDLPDLPWSGRARTGHGLPERRLVEMRLPGAQPCWKLYTTGSVGGQALTGLPVLWRLLRDPAIGGGIAVWPFTTGWLSGDAPILLVETYPSLLAAAVRAAADPIRDRAQVRLLAAALAALDAQGGLDPLFARPAGLSETEAATAAAEEGWVLGCGHAARLADALPAAAIAAVRAAGAAPPAGADPGTGGVGPSARSEPDGPAGPKTGPALPAGLDWLPVDTALARLRARAAPVAGVETVPLDQAAARILARTVRAARAHPAQANAAVDGYGFAHGTLGAPPHVLPLAPGRAAAGHPVPRPLPPGQAIRVLTGAPLPEGVDTVILQEEAVRDGATLRVDRAPKPGANTRPAAEDVAKGAPILSAGRRLSPGDIALAAAAGLAALPVVRRLRVAVLSTGDEIAPPTRELPAHLVADANRPMLIAVVRRWGMEAVDLGIAPDAAPAIAAALDRGAAAADAILTSGGASAGDADHMAGLLRRSGGLDLWRVAVKPGRPLAAGHWQGVPVFALPGNPVATLICTLIFARPVLMAMAGAGWRDPDALTLPAAFAKRKRAGRREYLRARIEDGRVQVFATEGSGRVSGLSWAEGLVELGDGAADIRPGDPVRFLPFAAFDL